MLLELEFECIQINPWQSNTNLNMQVEWLNTWVLIECTGKTDIHSWFSARDHEVITELYRMWPDLPKGVLCMHSYKTHFSLPSVSYINAPTWHLFNAAESWTVCFHSGLFLKPVWHREVLGWPLNGPIFPWQADSRLWTITRLSDKHN